MLYILHGFGLSAQPFEINYLKAHRFHHEKEEDELETKMELSRKL